MKKYIAIILAALMIFTLAPGVAMADENDNGTDSTVSGFNLEDLDSIFDVVASGNCGENVTWSLNSVGLLTISGSGDMEFEYDEEEWEYINPWEDYLDNIKFILIKDGVTSITKHAFRDCANLIYIKIASSVTSIGTFAFSECSSLKSVLFSNDSQLTSISNYAFYYCQKLKNMIIPSNVTTIGADAFLDCSSLTKIYIPASVTSLNGNVFGGCGSLVEIKVDSDNTVYDSRNKSNAIIETATNTLITGCVNTNIPSSVTKIGDWAFNRCKRMTSVTFLKDSQLTEIGRSAFYGCSGLTEVDIPSNVVTIQANAFKDCVSLGRIHVPSNVTSIGENALLHTRSDLAIYGVEGTCAETYAKANGFTFVILCDVHTSADPVKENIVEATCFKEGSYDSVVYCSVCGKELSRVTVIVEKLTPTIKISTTKKTLAVKKSFTIKVSGLAKGDSVKSFKSSKTKVATVNSKGKVTAKSKGTAVITVTLKSGKTAKCKVTVK